MQCAFQTFISMCQSMAMFTMALLVRLKVKAGSLAKNKVEQEGGKRMHVGCFSDQRGLLVLISFRLH